ncbi:MAG: bacteriocin family protein [Actinobacteria bacterium]|nr:bacteriocin family protein [Actinomycetota bacterium]
MNHLLRSHAPITDKAWEEIDREARERLVPGLAARKLVDFEGPHGWRHSATNLGRTEAIEKAPFDGLQASRRRVLPLVELRAQFTIARSELMDLERGAADLDLESLDQAAGKISLAENIAVFNGWKEAGIVGIAQATTHKPLSLGADHAGYPSRIAKAVETLRNAGIGGPYGLALGPKVYTAVVESTEHGGYLVFDHLHHILGGPIVWAPGVEGAILMSQRGSEFLFESGQDISVGYSHHDAERVYLYLEETFSFRVAQPDAAVVLS